MERGELLGVPLLHLAESAELALDAIKVAVVVSVAGDKAVAADVVVNFNALNDMDWKRDLCYPWFPRRFVGEVEPGGRRVLHDGFGADIVARLPEQVRLVTAHQTDVAHLPLTGARQG